MKIGIIGFPQSGKKTLFKLLAHNKPSEQDLGSGRLVQNIAEIRDSRLDFLVNLYKPKKYVRARIDFDLLPKVEHDSITEGSIFENIADVDALCHVVRVFRNDSVYHVDGSVDPERDINALNSELILHDMVFIEKRLERIERNIKKIRDKTVVHDKELLERLKNHLEKELPLRLLRLNKDEETMISSYPFLTRKEMIIVLNVSDTDLGSNTLQERFRELYKPFGIDVMQVSALVESEIAQIESEEERREFLQDSKIEEPAINILTRLCIKALNRISFFTVGQDEVRQWTIRSSSTAPEAAGAIHTDMQKGFIKAEVMKYQDLFNAGSESKVKEQGRYYLKGKDYIVQDGDILGIRFNV